jgi:hypothetical protein
MAGETHELHRFSFKRLKSLAPAFCTTFEFRQAKFQVYPSAPQPLAMHSIISSPKDGWI